MEPRLLRMLKQRALAVAGRLFSRAAPLPQPFEPRKILVMQLQQLGDSVVFTPTLRAIRQRFPGARIDMLVNPVSHALYRKCPYITRFYRAEHWHAGRGGSSVGRLAPLIEAIRAERYDLVVTDVTQVSFTYAFIAWLTRAPVRVGFNVGGHGFLHTLQLPWREDANFVDSNLDVARALGAAHPDASEEIHTDDLDAAHAAGLAQEASGAPLVLMHVGSNWQSRRWFPERWAQLADSVVREGARVAFVGSTGEKEETESIRRMMKEPSVSFVGRTDILQLARLLALGDLYVGTDSGPRHVARAAGVRRVAIMSSQNDRDHWVGIREGEAVLRTLPPCKGCHAPTCSHRTCMDLITVGDAEAAVLASLREVTAGRRAPGASTVPVVLAR